MAPMSLQQILSVGCQPQAKRAIVVKGVVAPRAAYEPVCPDILLVDTPGVTRATRALHVSTSPPPALSVGRR